MKKISVFIIAQLWLILFCFSAFGQDFQTVHDGIEYAKVIRQSKSADGKDENVVISLLRLDLTKVRLDVVHAMDAAIGLEKTSSIAGRYGAVAAINAGFFRIDQSIYEGDDVGALMINGKLLSESNGRTSLQIRNDNSSTQVEFEQLDPTINVLAPNHIWKLSGINRERKTDDLILFTPEFHFTTLTNINGTEITVENGKIAKISNGSGSSQIPANGFVLSAAGKSQEELKSLKIGDKITIDFPASYFRYKESLSNNSRQASVAEDIITGSPRLIKDGKINITWQEEKTSKSFVETHHPRTAVAKLKDGKFLMVTIDGRSEESGGMSLYQLADFLLEQGAIDALNLDGGGSSTMFLDGKIVNHPSDKEGERKVGDALLVFPQK